MIARDRQEDVLAEYDELIAGLPAGALSETLRRLRLTIADHAPKKGSSFPTVCTACTGFWPCGPWLDATDLANELVKAYS